MRRGRGRSARACDVAVPSQRAPSATAERVRRTAEDLLAGRDVEEVEDDLGGERERAWG